MTTKPKPKQKGLLTTLTTTKNEATIMIFGRAIVGSRNAIDNIIQWKGFYLFGAMLVCVFVTFIVHAGTTVTPAQQQLVDAKHVHSSNNNNMNGDGGVNNSVLKLTSTAFHNNEPIPSKYSDVISPPLEWSTVDGTTMPPTIKSFVLIVDDPDAPDPTNPKVTWVHWVVYNIPPTITQFEEGISMLISKKKKDKVATTTSLIKQGQNDWKRNRYDGPSPPIGRHRYFFKLYALDVPNILNSSSGPVTKPVVLDAIQNHILYYTELIGTYENN